jgi:hypothetical protein
MEVTFPRGFPIDLNFHGLEDIANLKIVNKRHVASLLRNLVQAKIDYDRSILKDEFFWTQALRVLSRLGHVALFFGDSHTRVFRQTIRYGRRFIIPLNILCGGGSASGLPNKNSRSGYGVLLEDCLKAIAQASQSTGVTAPLCFAFGQVDAEFVHTYRRLKRKELSFIDDEFKAFCRDVAPRYVAWVKEVAPQGAFIVGVNPPCLNDPFVHDAYLIQMQVYLRGGVADVRDEDSFDSLLADFDSLTFPDKKTRTGNHRTLNLCLQAEAQRLGVAYIDSFDRFLGSDGCISPRYASANEGGVLRPGVDGKDIHIGGRDALQIQAALAKKILGRFLHASADA